MKETYITTFEVTITTRCHTSLEARCLAQNMLQRVLADAAKADDRIAAGTMRMLALPAIVRGAS